MTFIRYCFVVLLAAVLAAADAEIAGDAAAPIRHQPHWRGEGEILGYRPAYQPGTVSFDHQGRAVLRSGGMVQFGGEDGGWTTVDLRPAMKAAYPAWNGEFQQGGYADEHVAFDGDGDAYTLINATRSNAGRIYLLHSSDRCRTWTAHELGIGYAAIEQRDSFTGGRHPPALLLHDAGMTGNLRLALPAKKQDGGLSFRFWTISDDSCLPPNHSGAGNSLVSIGDRVHIVWPGKEPASGHEGTAQYAISLDRTTGRMGERVLLGYGGHGAPDNHNIPAVTADRDGILHVVLGAHHDPFLYLRSLQANRTDAGWSEPETFGEPKKTLNEGSYTYAGWMCDPAGNLHCIARWAGDGYFMRLVHLRKPAGGTWEPQRLLVVPFSSGYSVYHHKPSIAPDGRLFVWYHYGKMGSFPVEVSTYARKWPDRDRTKVVMLQHQAVLTSADQGRSWHLASSPDLGVKAPVLAPATVAELPAAGATVAWTGEIASGGRLGSVARSGAQCYVSNRDRILAIGGGDQPAPVGSWTVPGLVEDLAAVDGFLLAAVRGKGLEIYRTGAPGLPVKVATLPLSTPRRLSVSPGEVVVACDDAVRVLALSPEGQPAVRCMYKGGGKAAEAVRSGTHLYIARGADGLEVVDVGDPAAPRSVGFAFRSGGPGDKGNTAWSVAVVAGRLLTAPGPNPPYAVRVLDLQDPAHPALIGDVAHTRSHWGWGRRIRTWGSLAAIGAEHGLAVIDLAGANLPVKGEWKLQKGATDVAAINGGLLVTDGAGGMCRFAGGDPATLVPVSTWSGPRLPMSLCSDGTRLAVADWEDGLLVHRLADNGTPAPSPWRLPLAGRIQGAALAGDLVLAAQGTEGLGAYTLLPDGTTREIGTWPCGQGARAVAVAGSWVVVAEAYRSLRLFRREGQQLAQTGSFPVPGEVLSLAGIGPGSLLAGMAEEGGRGMVVRLEIGTDGSLRENGRVAIDCDPWGLVAEAEGYLMAGGSAGLWRITLPDAGHPVGTWFRVDALKALPPVFGAAITSSGLLVTAHGDEGLAWGRMR